MDVKLIYENNSGDRVGLMRDFKRVGGITWETFEKLLQTDERWPCFTAQTSQWSGLWWTVATTMRWSADTTASLRWPGMQDTSGKSCRDLGPFHRLPDCGNTGHIEYECRNGSTCAGASPSGRFSGMTAVEGIYVEPLGCCLLVERSGDRIKRIFFSWDPPDRSSELVEQIADHLLNGRPCQADQELTGLTAFQREVFQVVSAIPRGKTLTYGEVAKLMGKPGAARAVGRALGANPFAILVPCHRAVSRSDLGAYFLGKDLKKRLLDIESWLRQRLGED